MVWASQSVYYAIGFLYRLARHVDKNATMEQVQRGLKQNGFTLLELLITLSVALIIGSIAVPAYQHSIQQGRKHIMQSRMLSLHLQQQHFYLSNQKYASESELDVIPTEYYSVSIKQSSENDFVIIATAKHSQKTGTHCDTLSINQHLIKRPDDCW